MGVIIVGIIILAVLLALNLFVSLDGTGIESIMGYDCAEKWDFIASASIDIATGGDLGENAKLYAKTQKEAEEFRANNCQSTVAEWEDRSEYQFSIPDDWR
ncbi:hypothetical protein HQ489_00515 [Candidatus Woesearchaeota archaeon]|nr:hypothetical protein [Candidatus Woesearchaeota archaeon]